MNAPTSHPVVSADEWLAQRHALLAREKALTRLHDEVAAQRRALPRTRVDKRYTLDTLQGPRALADLFDGRSQLLVQHFMFGPGWEQGCPSCSFMADHMGGMEHAATARCSTTTACSRSPPMRRRASACLCAAMQARCSTPTPPSGAAWRP